MDSWKQWTKPVTIPGEKMFKLKFETPDAGGKMGLAIFDHLMRLYQYSQEENVFANPSLTLNDTTVPDYAGGALGAGTGELSQGRPIIQIPPSQSGDVFCTPPDPANPTKKTLRVVLNLSQAAIILHETNHAIHLFVNHGEYMHPKSSEILGAVDQDLNMGVMSKALQTKNNYGAAIRYKKANEMETYWLCCCDAAKYQFSEDAIKAIKVVNNKNLLCADYEVLANQKQADTLQKNIDNDNIWENMFDIEKEDPTKYNPPSDDVFKDFYDDENKETTNEV